MNICLNSLIEWEEVFTVVNGKSPENNSLIERVIYLNELLNEVVVINIHCSKALPVFRQYNDLKEAIYSGNAKVLTKDPFDYLLRPENSISESSKKIREEAWEFFCAYWL